MIQDARSAAAGQPLPPDWERLAVSETWQQELQPLLRLLQVQAEAVLRDPRQTQTIEQVRFLQGKAAAYEELLTEPEKRARLDRLRREREEEAKEEERYGTGNQPERWLSRVGRKLGARSR